MGNGKLGLPAVTHLMKSLSLVQMLGSLQHLPAEGSISGPDSLFQCFKAAGVMQLILIKIQP